MRPQNKKRPPQLGSVLRKLGALDRTRTYDPQLRKLMLYPLSYERERFGIIPKPTSLRETSLRPASIFPGRQQCVVPKLTGEGHH